MSEAKWYRTSKGTKRHAMWECGNARRDIMVGPMVEIPAGEVDSYEACSVCADGATTVKPAANDKPEQCRNSGVTHPHRVYSTCRDCGKEGKVNRRTGTIRGHAPIA